MRLQFHDADPADLAVIHDFHDRLNVLSYEARRLVDRRAVRAFAQLVAKDGAEWTRGASCTALRERLAGFEAEAAKARADLAALGETP